MGAFTQVMVNATGTLTSGMSEALGGKEAGDKVEREIKHQMPEVNEKMKSMISEMRKEIYVQMDQKKKDIGSLLSDPAFDSGPTIIEKYDFKMQKLTQELDDDVLAKYLQLLTNENPEFLKMFSEVTEWLNSLPKLPEKLKQN